MILIIVYKNFIFHLPVKTRRLLLLAGTLYIGGAVGIELIGGHYWDLYGPSNMQYEMIANAEELHELFGIILLIYALISYMNHYVQKIQIDIKK